MRRVLLLASALACFSGCFLREAREEDERTERMQALLAPWVGHNIHQAIDSFGPPTQRYENGPTVLYMWHHAGAFNISAFMGPGGGGASAWTPSCDIQLSANEAEKIVSWRWQGSC